MSENETRESTGPQESHNCFCMGTGPELYAMFKRLGVDSACQHFRNARIEMLKGIRALIDKRIADLSVSPEAKGTKVTVE